MRYLLTSVPVFILAISVSCSDTQRIADASGVIRANASESKARFERIEANADINPPAVKADAKAGKREQVAILAASEEIVRALPGVKDVTPWWASLLSWGLIALSVVGVVALLWMTGLGAFVKRLLAAVGLMIPAAERREANLAAKAIDYGSDVSVREWIAARRASDPMFDAAYRRERRDRKKRASAERPAAH